MHTQYRERKSEKERKRANQRKRSNKDRALTKWYAISHHCCSLCCRCRRRHHHHHHITPIMLATLFRQHNFRSLYWNVYLIFMLNINFLFIFVPFLLSFSFVLSTSSSFILLPTFVCTYFVSLNENVQCIVGFSIDIMKHVAFGTTKLEWRRLRLRAKFRKRNNWR